MKPFLIAICLFFFSSPAFAQTPPLASGGETTAFFQVESATPAVHEKMNFNAGATLKLNDDFSLRFFTLMNGGWAQAYVGPMWTPLPWMKLAIGAGGRQGPDEIDLQTGYMLWLGSGRVSFSGAVEAGRLAYSGDETQVWYDLTARVQVLPWLTFGLKDRRPAGVGPLAEFNVWKLTFWSAWVPFSSEKAKVDWARFLVGTKIVL